MPVNPLTIGAAFGESTRRNRLTRLLEAVGTDENGKLNSPSTRAGVVNNYIAALPYADEIKALAQAARVNGKLAPQTAATINRGFAAAERTDRAFDDIKAYVDDVLPKRLKKVDTSGYQPVGKFLDLEKLREHPAEVMGTKQQSQLLAVPNTFNMDEFTSRFNPERVRAMNSAAVAGGPIGGPFWYNMAPVYQKMVDKFGPDVAPEMFKQWAKDNAALSPRSGVVDQTVRESQLNYFRDQNGVFPTNAELKDVPDMFGHIANAIHTKNMGEGELVKLGGKPKIGSYFQNYMGNWEPGTMDVHHFSVAGLSDPVQLPLKKKVDGKWVPKLDSDGNVMTNQSWAPDDRFYTPLELATMHMANRHGMQAAPFQATVWTGLAQRPELMPMGKKFAPRTSDPYAAVYDDVLMNSAGIRNKSPDDMFVDAMTRADYLTRGAGAAKARNNKLKELQPDLLDMLDSYAEGGTVSAPATGANIGPEHFDALLAAIT